MVRHQFEQVPVLMRSHGCRWPVRLGLGVVVASALASCGTTATQSKQASNPSTTTSYVNGVSRTAPASFAGINWSSVTLPGRDLVPPGMTPDSYCDMAPLYVYPSHTRVIYYLRLSDESFAVVPVECSSYNQSPISFLLFKGVRGAKPQLVEVIYEGSLSPKLLTNKVPTASIAALKPHGWSGLFYWNGPGNGHMAPIKSTPGIQLTNGQLKISGLVIPTDGTVPAQADSTAGMTMTTYTYQWKGGLFHFVGASAGVPPLIP